MKDSAEIFDSDFTSVLYVSPLALSHDNIFVNELEQTTIKSGKTFVCLNEIPKQDILEDYTQGERLLLILDDFMCFKELDGNYLVRLSSLLSHHLKFSVAWCMQNPFQQGKIDLVSISRNATFRFVLYQRNDWYLYSLLNRQIFPDRKKFILNCLEEAEKHNLNYICINSHPRSDLPRKYMCYTGIFNGEVQKGPLVFQL